MSDDQAELPLDRSGYRWRFFVGGILGFFALFILIRAFLAPGFSLDPAAFVLWNTASGEIEGEGASADIKLTNFGVGVLVAASGWIL